MLTGLLSWSPGVVSFYITREYKYFDVWRPRREVPFVRTTPRFRTKGDTKLEDPPALLTTSADPSRAYASQLPGRRSCHGFMACSVRLDPFGSVPLRPPRRDPAPNCIGMNLGLPWPQRVCGDSGSGGGASICSSRQSQRRPNHWQR